MLMFLNVFDVFDAEELKCLYQIEEVRHRIFDIHYKLLEVICSEFYIFH